MRDVQEGVEGKGDVQVRRGGRERMRWGWAGAGAILRRTCVR